MAYSTLEYTPPVHCTRGVYPLFAWVQFSVSNCEKILEYTIEHRYAIQDGIQAIKIGSNLNSVSSWIKNKITGDKCKSTIRIVLGKFCRDRKNAVLTVLNTVLENFACNAQVQHIVAVAKKASIRKRMNKIVLKLPCIENT